MGEKIGRHGRTTDCPNRKLVGAGGASETEIDAAGEELGESSELLRDDVRRVVGKHDSAGGEANGFGRGSEMGEDEGGRGAGDAGRVVVLRYPDSFVSKALEVDGEVAGVIERGAGVASLFDSDQIEDG